jgi:phosphonopyruvate decarboxylase
MTLSLVESLRVLHEVRDDAVVVTAMGVAREWMAIGSHPLDFNFVPSSMGQAPGLGLGIALARPDRKVIVCNGDGSTLMNLGSLVTLTAAAAENLTLLIFDNGVYEVTGAQLTPASPASGPDGRFVDLAAVARASGFQSVYEFDEIDAWREQVRTVIDQPGPTCAVLKVAAIPGAVGPKSPGPAPERARAFAAALRE